MRSKVEQLGKLHQTGFTDAGEIYHSAEQSYYVSGGHADEDGS